MLTLPNVLTSIDSRWSHGQSPSGCRNLLPGGTPGRVSHLCCLQAFRGTLLQCGSSIRHIGHCASARCPRHQGLEQIFPSRSCIWNCGRPSGKWLFAYPPRSWKQETGSFLSIVFFEPTRLAGQPSLLFTGFSRNYFYCISVHPQTVWPH